jgi:thiamine pyrophosphate-dependent acetolactate synthase large subunit-like protein
MAETTTGARVAELLHAEGIDTLFSICDVSYNAIHKRADALGMRIVGPRHESAGVHMADGLARMTGRPQVVMAGMGPGVANLLPGVVCASIEHIPVVVIATQRTRSTHSAVRRSRFQYSPQIRLFEPAVKYAAMVDDPRRIDEILHEAFRQATTGTPGPAYVEIPQDVLLESREFAPPASPRRYRLGPEEASEAAVEQAADMLRAARLPILLSGTAVHTARAHDALARLAEILRCPVIPTPGGRGTLPETHPQTLIFIGPGAEACREADCVLAVGTSIGESFCFGGPPQFGSPEAQRWICVERDAAAVGVNREIDLPLVGDLRAVLPQLASALEKRGPFEAPAQLSEWRRRQEDLFRLARASAPETSPIHPGRAVLEVREAVPDDAVLVRDGGSTGLWEAVYNQQRSRDFLWTSKFGHLGTGLPYALAAQLAVGRDRRVCLISGDSAFGFYAMELETAARHELPILAVVNYDQHWGMEHAGQLRDIGKLVECRTAPVRLDRLAEALGGHGEYCTRTDEIQPAVERGLASGKPSVVQIVTDARVNADEAPGMDQFATWYEGAY